MKPIQVLLVDDSPEFLAGISNFLSKDPHFSVAGTARTGEEAVRMAEEGSPDLVLMDIAMPGMNGLDAAKVIKGRNRSTKVIMLTLYDIGEYRSRAKELGTDGFISKADFVYKFPMVASELFGDNAETEPEFRPVEAAARPVSSSESKRNCWEFKNCGRGPASADACPAATETRLNGVHGGRNSGRACWVVAGTYCGGNVQGTFARKFDTCEKCEFYRSVKAEERQNFQLSAVLLSKVK